MYHEIDQTLPLVAAMFGAEFVRVEMTDDTGLHFTASPCVVRGGAPLRVRNLKG